MRKALALLAAIGAFMLLSTGIASAQQYPGTTAPSTTVPGTETVTPTTAPATTPTTQPGATTTVPGSGVGAGGAGAGGAGQLPATGSESLPLAQLAVVLVAAGGIALLAVRRSAPASVNADS